MKKTCLLGFVLSVLLCGCVSTKEEVSEILPKTPLEQYKECMGYSDKSVIHTVENPKRYFVVASEASTDQQWANKKEYGQVYYTSLLECPIGKTLQECQDQQSLFVRNIGTKTKWKVGTIKELKNVDFMFEKDVQTTTTKDGRWIIIKDYCFIDRDDITNYYCGWHIHQSEWRKECKNKLYYK